MAEINRNTVLALVAETTEGTPVAPSAGTDFTAIQDDLDISPSFDVLENAELKSSIGKGKPIIGMENPQASFTHYLRHSGTEGDNPDFAPLLKSVFGSETVNSTQRSTTTSSSTSIIKLASGGSDFARGMAVLIKDGTNGYSIRPVHSVSTNDLTLGFNVAAAPASGIGVGKCVNYSPASSGHQALSVWAFRANRGAVELMSGGRVTEMSVDFSAGDLIAAAFSLEGMKYYYNPVKIGSTDVYLDFLDDATTRAAVVTAKMYTDPHELAAALQTSMNALGSTNTFTVAYSDTTGKYTLTSSGTTFTLKWSTGTNAANTIGDKIGFDTTSDDSSALTYTSDNAITLTAPYTPIYDSADPIAAKDNEVLIGDSTDSTTLTSPSVSFTISNERSPLDDVSNSTGRSGSLITGRTVTVSVKTYITQYDVSKFKRFRAGTDTRFCYVFGTKSGGNWVAGKSGCIYMPSAVISSFKVTADNGILFLEMELQGYIDSSGNGEVYLNFL